MEIGAIITVAGGEEATLGTGISAWKTRQPDNGCFAWCDVLGKNLTDRAVDRLRAARVEAPVVIVEGEDAHHLFPSRSPSADKFLATWEAAVASQLNAGIHSLLLMRLDSYVDFDAAHLLDFHHSSSASLTHAYSHKSALEVAVVDAAQLRAGTDSYRTRLSRMVAKLRRYEFAGYVNRLRHPQGFRTLAQDGLLGRAGLVPVGKEVSPGIWMANGVRIDASASIVGPAYVGASTEIKASCKVVGATTIERDCKIDFGTTVNDCSVLPETYVGIGLNVRRAIVGKKHLFNLDRDVEIEISDNKIIGRNFSSLPVLSKAKSLWTGSANSRLKTICQPSAYNSHLY